MGTRFLIDSNAVVDLLDGKLPPASAAWLQAIVQAGNHVLSVINRIEILSPQLLPAERQQFEDFLRATLVVDLPEAVVLETIRIRQLHKRKLPDAVIAATALVFGLPLITRNVADFKAISGLTVIDPHDPINLPSLAE